MFRNRIMTFLCQGFECFPNQFSDAECRTVVDHLNEIEQIGSRCLLDQAWCQTLAAKIQNRLATTLPQLSGLRVIQCTYFNKSIDDNWLVAFHQDRSIPVSDRVSPNYAGHSRKEGMTFGHGPDSILGQMIALRLHLDGSTLENGPLRVLPETHCHGTLSQERIQNLRQTIKEEALAIANGGIIALRPLLLHASSKSLTTEPRRVLHFLFGPIDLPDGLDWRE